MQIICDKNLLTDALSVCIHATVAKSPIPALEGILITAEKSSVTLCGYNTQMSIQKTIDSECDESKSFILPARIFFDIMRKLKGETVKIEIDDNLTAVISCGRAVFNLKAEAADQFPDLPYVNKHEKISMPCSQLRQMINDTIFAISANENRPILMGSFFDIADGNLTLVSCDGYQLAVRKEEVKSEGADTFSFVVPGSTLKELARILPDTEDEIVSVYPEKKHGLFEFAQTMVTTRLLEGEYLNYRSTIPSDMPVKMTVNKSEIIEAVERVSLMTTERLKNPVKCTFEEETLKLTCVTALGRSYDEVEIPCCPEKITIGFNNRYLLDALKACPDEEVIIELKSDLSPCIFKPTEGDKFVFLVLPVRLKAEDK